MLKDMLQLTLFLVSLLLPAADFFCRAEELTPQSASALAMYNFLLDISSARKDAQEPEYDSGRLLNAFFCMQCDDVTHTAAVIEQLKRSEERHLQDIGFDFRVRYSKYIVDNDEFVSGRDNIQVGIVWDLLNEGLFGHRRIARETAMKRDMEEIADRRSAELYPCHDTMMMCWFGRQKLAVIKQKLKVLEVYTEALRGAYLRGAVFADDFFKAESVLRKTASAKRNLEEQERVMMTEQNDALPPQAPAPLLDLNIKRLIKAFNDDKKISELSRLEREIARSRNDAFNRWNFELSLDAVRNSSLEDEEIGHDLRFGASLRFPLTGYTDKHAAAEEQEIVARYAREKSDRQLDILRTYNGYEEKLYDAVTMKFRRKIAEERLRRAIVALKHKASSMPIDSAILIAAAKQLIELLDVDFEMLAVKESLYRKILHLFLQTGIQFNPAYLEKPKIDSDRHRARTGQRWVYIWSKEFNETGNDVLFDFLQAKGAAHVLLSAGEKTSASKLAAFLADAAAQNVAVELMASNNNWIFPERLETAVKEAQSLWETAPFLHLDVEPHVLEECKSFPQVCWQQYLSMIKRLAAIKKPQQRLSVSLPTSIPADILNETALLVDMIHIMAYGKTDMDFIQRKLEKFKDIKQDKISLALRPKDFKDEYEMESFIDKVSNLNGIANFSIHDIDQYQNMCSGAAQ